MKLPILTMFICFVSLISCCTQTEYQIFEEYKKERYDNIVLLGDTQRTSFWEFWREQNDAIREIMFPRIVEKKPCAIVILGDLVFLGSSNCQWIEFDRISKCVRDNAITIYPLLGNHNYYGNNEEALKNYSQRFPYLDNLLWYDRKLSPSAFLFLNANFSQLSPEEVDAQNAWYEKKLREYDEDPQIKYIFVCDHQPPFTNSSVVPASDEVKKYFLPKFLASRKTKIFFSGHVHSYEHFLHEGKHFVISGGGGGPRHSLYTDSAPNKDLFSGPSIRKFHYCKLTIGPDNLLFEMVAFDPGKNAWVTEDSWRP